ncbi:MAG: ATP-binding protein [Caldilineaceae bacterium]
MARSLAERLAAARRSRFVGRTVECTLFQQALTAAELPFYVLHLYGPGGVGKTTLLREFAHLAQQTQTPAIQLDARAIDPTPVTFTQALQQALGVQAPATVQHALAQQGRRCVILVDSAETLAPLDHWLRDDFFPQLPANVLTVFASRNAPTLEWRTDPGWQSLMQTIQLRNLAPDESQSYLAQCQIPTEQHQAILSFTHGHPLALSLMVDLVEQQGNPEFRPAEAPNVIAALVERFIAHVPSPEHRTALEASAMVRMTTEPLLGAMLEQPDVHHLFAWLRTLSFFDAEREGLYPHDLAREAIAADLRWRNPERYAHLHACARNYYMVHFPQSDDQAQQAILYDTMYLHRDNPMVQPFFEWQTSSSLYNDSLKEIDKALLLAMVARHEGAESAALAAAWLERQPELTVLCRDAANQVQGFLIMVALEQTTPHDHAMDPAVMAAWRYLEEEAPLRTGERATLFRFWMAHDSYQEVSAVQSQLFLTMVQHYLTTPGLAYTFLPCADPNFWQMVFAYADLERIPAADFAVAGKQYGLYGHDWRTTPPLAWLDLLATREISLGVAHKPPQLAETMLVLSQSEFMEAVRNALRDFHNPTALRTNPLLKSRVLQNTAPDATDLNERVAYLQDCLRATADLLRQSPRQMKLFRALHHTYLQPAATQEQAAELLDLPFSTYRRHLRAGVEFLCETLWQREMAGE